MVNLAKLSLIIAKICVGAYNLRKWEDVKNLIFFMEFLFSTLLLFFALPYSIQFCAVNKFSSIRHQVAGLFMLW